MVSALFLIRLKPRARGVAVEAGTVLSELRAGWSEFRARPWVWGTVLIFPFLLIFAFAPYTVLGPTVAEREFGGAGFYGVLAAALGAGTVGGALIGLRWRPERPLLRRARRPGDLRARVRDPGRLEVAPALRRRLGSA